VRKAVGELMSYKEIRENNNVKQKNKEGHFTKLISNLTLAQYYMDLAA